MAKSHNLSVRYINALRQMPQYMCNVESTGPLTHVMTGVRVLPMGSLDDPDDDSGVLEILYPAGHAIQVHAFAFFSIALMEAAEIEVVTSSSSLGIPDGKLTDIQRRVAQLGEHLRNKHGLEL